MDERFSSLIASILEPICSTSSLRVVTKLPIESFTSSLKSTNLLSTLLSESTINFLYEGTSSPINPFTVSDNSANSFFIPNRVLEFTVFTLS